MIVLCLNDYPIGVYTTSDLADAAALADWKRREPRWEAQDLRLGQSMSGFTGYKYMRYFYHQHEFALDAEAKP
jgi:hypothetical protein